MPPSLGGFYFAFLIRPFLFFTLFLFYFYRISVFHKGTQPLGCSLLI